MCYCLYGLNTVFDAIFVGWFVGETALAGISIAYHITMIAMGFTFFPAINNAKPATIIGIVHQLVFYVL